MIDHARLVQLPLAVLILLFGVLSGAWVVSAGLLGVVALSRWPAARLEARVAAQLLASLVGVVSAFLLTAELTPDRGSGHGTLGSLWVFVSLTGLLLAVPRVLLRRPLGGAQVTAALGLVTLMGCGGFSGDQVLAPAWYAGFCLAWILLVLARLAQTDAAWTASRSRRLRLPPGFLRRSAVVAAVAVVVTAPLIAALPPLHRWVIESVGFRVPPRSGFSQTAALGSLDDLLLSDEVVLRVRGPAVDHLRGIAYTHYARGRWVSRPRHWEAAQDVAGGQVSVRAAGDQHRYFVPLGATRVSSPDGPLVRDGAHGFYRPREGLATEVRFDPPRGLGSASPPAADDLLLPDDIGPVLRRIAAMWTAGAADAHARVAAIAERLQGEYRYSLDFEAAGGVDPVLDFLLRRKTGHCEYFASSMTLLARAAGVPARMVGGYRVTERNPLTGERIVRQRNAHAWTEVWLSDVGWITVDATAAADLPMPAETPLLTALADVVGQGLRAAGRWLADRNLLELVVLVAVLGLLWRWVRRRRPVEARGGPTGAYASPAPGFVALDRALARAGLRREPSESLEHFADRVALSPRLGPFGFEAAAAIRRYAAWRYGDGSDGTTLGSDLRALAHTAPPRK